MALTKCKECGKEISTEAGSCPHCGAKPAKTSGCALVFAAFVLMAVFGSIATTCKKNEAQNAAVEKRAALTPSQRAAEDGRKAAEAVVKTKEDLLATAKYACRQAVEERLHDPSGAEWARYRDFLAEEHASGIYHVQLSVRAKNAFNAIRLATFNCVLRASGDTWYTVSVTQQSDR